jgi:hygromycin-B 7''-O-kinase
MGMTSTSTPPTFASMQQHVSLLADIDFWWLYVAEILAHRGFADGGLEPVAGYNGSYPTFVYGDVVVKLFGYSRA